MKILHALGDELQAEKVTKSENEIVGYIDGIVVFRFKGIRDFSKFDLDGEWDEDSDSVESQLRKIKEENDELKRRLSGNEDAVLSLIDMTVMGGI